jgi:glycosyltransferase involved in cell wall biosynthesis
VDVSGINGRWASPNGVLSRRLPRKADRLVANCAAIRDEEQDRRVPLERWEVIANGVPPARPSDRTRLELLAELDLAPDARLVGAIGRHEPRRRTTDLIWAADLLRVLHDNMRLLVIGDGPERPQLERFARLASDLDHIRFLGQRDDVWRILPHLDVLWQEGDGAGQPQVVMEAMAAGVPVVASDTPAHRELVVHGQTGYLVPVAGRAARVRCTDRLLSDNSLAQQFGQASCQRMAEHFPLQRMVDAYARLYREVLSA